jgi:hypothetical protein
VTCYPGHDAGKPEEEAVTRFAAGLDPLIWSSCHHRWENRQASPSLLLIQRGKDAQQGKDTEDIAEAEAALKEYRKNGKAISHQEMKRRLS